MTLSSAKRAPPPITLVTLLADPPLMVSASSHTHSARSARLRFDPSPSMITFFSVAPGSTRNTAVCHSLSFWPWHLMFERA
ncbi:hypothetical protein PsorP6_009705 [Peronosclerospora sorghi]|uniref:Uncharacterized protein n=1 Tax=Peronosclerospora sorghi TaxID=230839 RepID=A0ACC0W1J0_9STRA|nr:hypothetical protein PsorP6_009705 [Peronosclerospora sorghi]